MKIYPDFYNESRPMCYSGCFLIRKTPNTVKLIKTWLELCENYDLLNQSPSKNYPERPEFWGNDYDNGLFNLCTIKYNSIIHRVNYEETNIYLPNGLQYHHLYPNNPEKYENEWEKLKDYPLQYRRDRPIR